MVCCCCFRIRSGAEWFGCRVRVVAVLGFGTVAAQSGLAVVFESLLFLDSEVSMVCRSAEWIGCVQLLWTMSRKDGLKRDNEL